MDTIVKKLSEIEHAAEAVVSHAEEQKAELEKEIQAERDAYDEELERKKDVVELQEFYLSRKDPIQIWHLDSRFHEIIYESCRSAPLKHTLSGFHHYILRARELSFKTAGRAVTSVQEHRNILEALQQRDGAAAERLTCEHIKNAKENLMHQFHEME